MKQFLKRILFIAILSLCASLTAFAQQDNDKRTPPKGSPPVVVVPPKKDDSKPKDDKKDNDKKPKKPDAAGLSAVRLVNIIFD